MKKKEENVNKEDSIPKEEVSEQKKELSLEEKANKLIRKANNRGGNDNISVTCLKFTKGVENYDCKGSED